MDNKINSHWPISLTNGAATMLNLFLPLLLVRILSPDEIGRYKAFFLYVTLSPGIFLVSGLNNGLYHWTGKYPETKPEVRQSWTFFSGIALFLSLLGLLFSHWLAPLIDVPVFDVRLFLVACPFSLIATFMEDLLIAGGRIWKGSIYGSGFQVVRAAGIAAGAYWGHTFEYVLWAFLGAATLRAFAGIVLVWRSGDLKPYFSKDISNRVLRYAFPVSVAALAGLALQNIDQMILSIRLNATQFAFYAMGCLAVPPLQVLEISVNRVLIPKMSQAFGQNGLRKAAALYAEGVLELFRILLPASMGLIIYANPIVRLLFTPRYILAAHYLRFYALFYLLMSIPYDAVARAIADGVWIMKLSLLFAPLFILTTWLSATHWGAMGVLIAFLSMHLCMRLYALTYQKSIFKTSYADFLPLKSMMRQFIIAVVLGFLCLAVHPLFTNERTWFLVTGPLFTVAYFAITYWFSWKHALDTKHIHVLELVQFLYVGGLEKMVYSLSRALHEDERFNTIVAAYDRLEDEQASLAPHFHKKGIPLIQWEKGKGFSFQVLTRLIQLAFSGKRKILHVHDLGPLIYGALAKSLSLGRIQLVVTVHTLLHVQQSQRYRYYFKFFLRFADRIIAVSSNVKTGLLELGISPKHIEIVPNGVSFVRSPMIDPHERQELKQKLMPQSPSHILKAKWLLYMARLHSGKGQDIVLNIWKALPTNVRQHVALIFVGPETEPAFVKQLRQQIAGMPDAHHILLQGPAHNPGEWIQAAHLFISGSQHEGMPLAPLEAAGSGLPLLLSDIPGHEFLKPWARTFNPHQPEKAAHKIMEILTLQEREGESTFFKKQWDRASILRDKWSETSMIASYMDVFESIWPAPLNTHKSNRNDEEEMAYAAENTGGLR